MFSNFSEIKFVSTSESILLGILYSENIILHVFMRLSTLKPSSSFTTGYFAVVICNTKTIPIINGKMSAPTDFPQSPYNFM